MFRRAAAAALVSAALAGPAAAAPPFAAGYWTGFKEYWVGQMRKTSGVVGVALGVGAVSLFIITRGKWKK